MSVVSPLAEVDWQIVAAGIATFIGTLYLTFQGMKLGKEKAKEPVLTAATIIEDDMSRNLIDQLARNERAMIQLSAELRVLTAAVVRQSDIDLMRHRSDT